LVKPTAVQDLGDTHDTPERKLAVASAGRGVRWIVQPAPFHRSVRVTPLVPELLPEWPTAVQVIVEAHDTPPR
jgi:hypothetical protein